MYLVYSGSRVHILGLLCTSPGGGYGSCIVYTGWRAHSNGLLMTSSGDGYGSCMHWVHSSYKHDVLSIINTIYK